MSDSDEDSVPSVVKERKGKWRMKGELDNEEDEDDGDTRCPDCVAKEGILEDLKFELNAERDAANETILMVEKMEERQRQEIEKLTLQLNIHKDRVAALTDDLEHERNARMQEIYQIERKTMENDHNMKDYKTMNEKNGNLDKELEAFQNENDTLVQVTEELRQNKLELVEQLRVYEDQVTDLEIKNDDLRKRLYDSDNQKDRHKVYASRMKKKLHDYMNGPTLKLKATRNNNNKSKSQSLGPLKSFDRSSQASYYSRVEGDSIFSSGGSGGGAGLSHLSSQNQGGAPCTLPNTRLRSTQSASHLSSVNYIRKFNADPITVSNSKKKNPMLWPVQY